MTIRKSSKVMALAICFAMLLTAMPFVALADGETLTIGTITVSEPVEGLVTVTVPYTAENVDQVTILAVVGGETAPAEISAENIGYIDQQDAEKTVEIEEDVFVTAFQFVIDTERFTEEDGFLHIKMGGTALEVAQSADPMEIVVETTGSFKVFGYVEVPVAVGATVSLGEGLSASTDADGKFEITGVSAGTYNLIVSAKSALTRTIPIIVEDADVEVSLETKKIDLLFGFTGQQDGGEPIIIDGVDLMAIKNSFGRLNGFEGYDEKYDFNNDGIIDGVDLMLIKNNFGKTSSSYSGWVK